jgi:uroporphyrinogen-III synthase
MIKSVLLTRAKSANSILKKKLLNYDLLECSLIEYELLPLDNSRIINYSDLIITSYFAASNAPAALGKFKRAWVVGENSSKLLRDKGYEILFCAVNAASLKQKLVRTNLHSAIYLSGNNITIDMPSYVERQIFYNTHYKNNLSKLEIQRYKQGVDYILLYSENCAKTLLQLLLDNDLVKYLENTTIVAISSKVSKVVKSYFKNIEICNDSGQMIEFLEKNR